MAFNWTTSNEGLLIIEAEVAEELKSALDTLETVNIAYDGSYNSVHKSGHYETYDSSYYTTHLGSNKSYNKSVDRNSHNSGYYNIKNTSCFIAGTKILLSNGSWKNIEDFDGGEKIIGLSSFNTVDKIDIVKLGNTRVLYTLSNNKIIFTGEHKFWGKNGFDYEGPMVVNINEFYADQENYNLYYSQIPLPINPLKEVYFAHINGWSKESYKFTANILKQWNPTIDVYSLKTDGDHTMIANGYVVSAWMNYLDTDYSKLKWEPEKMLKDINIQPLETYDPYSVVL